MFKLLLLLFTLLLSPASEGNWTLIREARTCFETGRHEACDSLISELQGLRLSRLQRRKVCTLLLDNTYHTGRHELFLAALDSKYVRRNLARGDYRYWRRVSRIPPTEAVWPAVPEVLPLRIIGPQGHSLYGVDITVNGKPLVGMIDNCSCHYCSVSTALAEELGIRPIGKTVKLNGNKRGKAYIGVLDSLSIGDLVVKNVLCDVSDHLEAVKASHPFDIVIGGNVLRRIGDMVIDNEAGSIVFSKETLDLPRNVIWTYENHDYYVEGSLDGKSVTMLLDTGGTNTHLNKAFLDRCPADSTYVEGTQETKMVDRVWTTRVYVIPKAHFAFCGAECDLPDVTIKLEDYGSSRGDGSFGVDALRCFKSVVFNAAKLYLQLNN